MRPRLVPVLDVMHGQVVHAVGGMRGHYRPLTSRLTDSCEPGAVAAALRLAGQTEELYLADLDAIAGNPPNLGLYRGLTRAGHRLWVDAGVRSAERAREVLDAGVSAVVLGLETVDGPSVVADMARSVPAQVVFSLDLKGGKPLGLVSAWRGAEPLDIARQAIECGVRRLLLLDLARVGTQTGPATERLATEIVRLGNGIELAVGGGIRDEGDLERLERAGADAVLVATALHLGTLSGSVTG
jgi:HisA/HisF family protein